MIFERCIARLKVKPQDIVFLDDIGANVKAAAKIGMKTIKVGLHDTEGIAALQQLSQVLSINWDFVLAQPKSKL